MSVSTVSPVINPAFIGTPPITFSPMEVATLIGAQEDTRIERERAITADDAAFIRSARATATSILAGTKPSAIVAAIKSSGVKGKINCQSAVAYHAMTGELFLLDGELPDGYTPRESGAGLSGVQSLVKSLTNGGMTREARLAVRTANTMSEAISALEALLAVKVARDADKSGTDGEGDDDDKTPKVKVAADYLRAVQGSIAKLAELTGTQDDAAAARALIEQLTAFASKIPNIVAASTVGVPAQRVDAAA